VRRPSSRLPGRRLDQRAARLALKEVLMEVRIDTAACAGHGVCEALAPHIFELDDDGNVHVVAQTLDEADRVDLENAVNQCPEQALRLIG
jgi:ferredoxin